MQPWLLPNMFAFFSIRLCITAALRDVRGVFGVRQPPPHLETQLVNTLIPLRCGIRHMLCWLSGSGPGVCPTSIHEHHVRMTFAS